MNGNNKWILFIRSNPVAPDPRVEKEARALKKTGYQVDVLCWAREASFPENEVIFDVHIFRLKILARYGRGISNLPALIRWQVHELFWLFRNAQKYTYLHACDFDTVLPALIYKWVTHKKLVYDIFDFYADHLRKTPRIIKRIIRKIDLLIINFVDCIILVDKNRQEQIAGSRPKNVVYIYNTPEDSRIELISKAPVRRPEKFHIAYVGLLQKERGLFTLLDCMQRHPEWQLDLAGFGGDEIEIKEKSKKLKNVQYYGRVNYEYALGLGAAADIFFALYDPQIPNHRYASPNKLFEAMMLGKPILVAKNTNIDLVVQEWECGKIVDYSDAIQIEQALVEFAQDPIARASMGKNSRRAYAACYNWKLMEKQLQELYTGLK